MPGLLKRVAAKRKQPPPPSPARLERTRRQRWGDDLYERLCGEGNAFDGAQQVIARAKESGAWFDPDAKKTDRQRFKLNRKETKRRIARLERRINGNGTDVEASKRPRLKRAAVEIDAALAAKVATAVKKAQGGKCERIQSIARALPNVSIPQLKTALAPHGFNPSTVGIQAALVRR